MSRGKKERPPLPVIGDEQFVTWLPRDIRLGWSRSSPEGTLLHGWCLTTDTFQLWQTVSDGRDAKAKFVGFICKKPE